MTNDEEDSMSELYQSLSHSKWDCKYHAVFQGLVTHLRVSHACVRILLAPFVVFALRLCV